MRSLVALLRGLNLRLGGFALLDQAVIGGTSFLTTIFIGRASGPQELGLFALGMTIWFLILAVLESLITSPFTVFVHRVHDSDRSLYAGSVLLHTATLAVLAALVLAVAGGCMIAGDWSTPFATILFALAASVPFRLLREFARRFNYAEFRVGNALVLDACMSVMQLGGMFLLYQTNTLTSAATFVVIGISSAVVSMFWIVRHRGQFCIRRNIAVRDLHKNWILGRWLTASQMIMIGGAQSLLWIITIALGDVKTGVYAACATLVCIGNPFLVAMHNVLVPRTSAVFAESGRAGLRRVVARTTIALIMTMTWFSVVLAIFGEWLVRTLYGAEFGGHQSVVTLLALSELAFAAILAVGAGLTVLERSDLLFRSHVTGLFVTIGLALALTGPLGLTGAALARFAGTATTATIIALCYRRISRDRTGSSDLPAFHVENITAIAQGTSPDQGVRLGRGL